MTLLLVCLGAAKLIAGLTAALVPGPPGPGPLPLSLYAAFLIAFGGCGGYLVTGGWNDPRARYLGASYVMFASLFADRVFARWDGTDGAGLVAIAHVFSRFPLVALATPMFWLFLTHFPTDGAIDHSPVVQGFVVFSLVAGGALFGLNVLGNLPSAPRLFVELAAWVEPHPGAGLFWVVGSLLTIPGLVYLGIKLRASTGAERRRLALFVSAVAAGLAPMVFDVLLSGIPAYASYFATGERRVQRAAVIMAFALLLPLSTAYVVTVGSVFDLRFYVRKAIQYLLARSTVWAAIAVPVVALLVFVWNRRDQALAEVLVGAPPTMWLVTVTAIALLAVRRRVFDALDRRFFREHYDARTILGGLVERIGDFSTPAELSNLVLEDIDRALHVDKAILFAATPTALLPLSPGYRELPLDSSLARLLAGSAAPLEVDLRPDRSVLSRIPPFEREWIAQTSAQLLVPLITSGNHLVGVLVLGAKRSELPYSADDRSLLRAVASAAALVLAHGFRTGQAPDEKIPTESADTGPGVECVDCGRLQTTDAPSLTCRACGGRTQAASLPDVVAGKYKVERRIGAGGMGVVYLAREIRLDRFVVLKTLPRVSNADVSHLNTEARAMAALQHENLAVIFGAERWRDRPVLIMEYLSGGTLADQLRQRRLSPYEAVSLGIVLAQALAHLHKRRLLHRDIKPSNIGFTEEGAPKLLDFGLSFFLPTTEIMAAETRTIHTLVEWVRTGTDPWSPQTLATHAQMVVGTPAYLCPEAIAMKPADARFDLWSLAVTLYESVAGVNPFQAENTLQTLVRIAHSKAPDIRQFRPDCSDAHASFFALALDPDASRRPASAADFRMALRELVREPV